MEMLAAALALADLGARRIDTLIIWTPTSRPLTDEGKKLDPFAAVAAVGEVFPAGAGDSYKALCLRARPENAVGIQRLFERQRTPRCDLRATPNARQKRIAPP